MNGESKQKNLKKKRKRTLAAIKLHMNGFSELSLASSCVHINFYCIRNIPPSPTMIEKNLCFFFCGSIHSNQWLLVLIRFTHGLTQPVIINNRMIDRFDKRCQIFIHYFFFFISVQLFIGLNSTNIA